LALRHERITDLGAVVAGISVDDPGRNAAMVGKLRLPFPLLADPGGEGAIKPYGLWHDEPALARPAVVVVGPDGEEAFRHVARDYADRIGEDEVVAQVERLALRPVTQEPPAPGEPRPGDRAFPVDALPFYFRAVRFAALALAGRVPEVRAESDGMVAEADRYLASLRALRSAGPAG
jgi:hypothetical protein